MKSINFGNKQASQITSNTIREKIKSIIKTNAGIDIATRQYQFLNEKNLHYLNADEFKVCINTFGQKYLLFLTNYNGKKYCLFINRKREDMIYVKMNFDSEIYENEGTLMDGELIKNNNNEWIYAITELIMFKGENLALKYGLDKRQEILTEIFQRQYHPEKMTDVCRIDIKTYFECRHLQDLYERYIHTLPYKCSGIYFRNLNDSRLAFMYIFPENRTGESGGPLLTASQINETVNENKNKMVATTSPVPVPAKIKILKREPRSTKVVEKPVPKVALAVPVAMEDEGEETDSEASENENGKMDITKEYEFLVRKTDIPDVYGLYRNDVKIGIAGISGIEVSKKLAKIFNGIDNDDIKITMKCRYSDKFSKWMPIL